MEDNARRVEEKISEDKLLSHVTAGLSDTEKELARIEVEQQAEHIFGGLTESERRRIGLKAGTTLADSESDDRRQKPQTGFNTLAEWLWAIVYVAMFCGIVYWVVSSK